MPGSSSKNGGWQWQTYSISQSGNCHWIIRSIPSPYGCTAATKSSHPSSFRSHMHWYPTGAPSHLRMAPIHVEHNTMLVSYQQQPLSWNGKASIKVVPSLWNVKHGEQHSQEHPKMGHPNCDAMKKKMSLVEPSITAEDIDALPWLHDGLRLNIAKMNALYLKWWQEQTERTHCTLSVKCFDRARHVLKEGSVAQVNLFVDRFYSTSCKSPTFHYSDS